MVALTTIRDSNERIASALPEGLIAVFVGATSGIGRAAIKQFAASVKKPRVYFVGRSSKAAKALEAELTALNESGTYKFIQSDVSLIKNVDIVCEDIKSKEDSINLLFLSCGTLVTGTKTEEGLQAFTALGFYSRMRFAQNFLFELRKANALRRVISILAGTKEGPVVVDNFECWKMPFIAGRGHLASMQSLALEGLAKEAPEVSFLHVYPGFVKSNLARDNTGFGASLGKGLMALLGPLFNIPLEQVGQCQTFMATSARFPPKDSGDANSAGGVPLAKGIDVAVGTDGKIGSGVYSVNYEGEPAGPKVQQLLASLRKDGSQKKLWDHIASEIARITGR